MALMKFMMDYVKEDDMILIQSKLKKKARKQSDLIHLFFHILALVPLWDSVSTKFVASVVSLHLHESMWKWCPSTFVSLVINENLSCIVDN